MQTRRFEALAGGLTLDGRRIADLGSGHGDLLDWLNTQGIRFDAYLGVEALAAFDQLARARAATRNHQRASFLHADFLADDKLFETLVDRGIDTILFSGSLNTLDEADALRVLERAWTALARSERGVLGFNFLSGGDTWERRPTNLPRRPTQAWIAWGLARTPELVFCQHYLGAHDATIVMVHPDT